MNADIVIIYCNPLFYLNIDDPPGDRQPAATINSPAPTLRMWQRLRDAVELPQALVDYRVRRQVAEIRGQHSPDWVFREVPQEQLRYFAHDYERLTTEVQGDATLILATHAISVNDLSTESRRTVVERFQQHRPRADPEVVLQFDRTANDLIRSTALEAR